MSIKIDVPYSYDLYTSMKDDVPEDILIPFLQKLYLMDIERSKYIEYGKGDEESDDEDLDLSKEEKEKIVPNKNPEKNYDSLYKLMNLL